MANSLKMQQFLHSYINKHFDRFNEKLFTRSNDAIIDQIEKIILSSQTEGYFSIRVKGFTRVDNYDEIQRLLKNYYDGARRTSKTHKYQEDDNRFNFIDMLDSDIILLIVHYEIAINNDKHEVDTADVYIEVPRVVKKFYFYLKGNYYSSMYQIVDASTYNNETSKGKKKATITLKTNFQPIRITRYEMSGIDTDGAMHDIVNFGCFAFKKTVSAIVYFFAKFGFVNTLARLGLENLVFVGNRNTSDEYWCSFQPEKGNNIFVTVNRMALDQSQLMQHVVYTILTSIESATTANDVYTNEFWVTRLGAGFVTTKKLEKGYSVLKSIESILDINIQEQLHLPWKYKKDIYSIILWMLADFTLLKNKDNMNVRNKKIRCGEYIAAMYATKLSSGIYRISNQGRKVTISSVKKAIYIKPDWLISEITKSQLVTFRNIVNDMDAFLPLKFTYKGISGVGNSTGTNGSKSVPIQFRLLDISSLGILDPDASSPSDPGVTGSLIPFLRISDNGYFSPDSEPMSWSREVGKLLDKYKSLTGLKELVEFKKDIDPEITDVDVAVCTQAADMGNNVIKAVNSNMESYDDIINKHLDAITGLPLEGSGNIVYDSGN